MFVLTLTVPAASYPSIIYASLAKAGSSVFVPKYIHIQSCRKECNFILASSLEYKICCMRSSAQSHQGSPESIIAYIVTYKCTTKIVIPQLLIGPRREKPCLRWFANNKGADQPAHPRSLISAFVIRLL